MGTGHSPLWHHIAEVRHCPCLYAWCVVANMVIIVFWSSATLDVFKISSIIFGVLSVSDVAVRQGFRDQIDSGSKDCKSPLSLKWFIECVHVPCRAAELIFFSSFEKICDEQKKQNQESGRFLKYIACMSPIASFVLYLWPWIQITRLWLIWVIFS